MKKQNPYVILIIFSIISIFYFSFLSKTSIKRYHQLNDKYQTLLKKQSNIIQQSQIISEQIARSTDPIFRESTLKQYNILKNGDLVLDIILPPIPQKQKKSFFLKKKYIISLILMMIITSIIVYVFLFQNNEEEIKEEKKTFLIQNSESNQT